jgi:demethylmenaquinone methyltransferase / 2-methoxy-6-polyprenyl-1,4-benzoquinol methylase
MREAPPAGQAAGKGEAVAAMFGRIAPRYDLLNRILSFGIDRAWRREAVAAVAVGAPQRVLDVATGTGDVALLLARALPGATVTGVDFSEPMLALARQKAARAAGAELADAGRLRFALADAGRLRFALADAGRLRFQHADALALPFPDASFDAVTVAYGVRNFADVAAGLREMRRVLVPGGRIAVLEFPPPDGRFTGTALRWYGRTVMPTLGRWLSGDPHAYAYLPASTSAFLAPERLADALRAARFGDVRYRLQTFGVSALHVGVAS